MFKCKTSLCVSLRMLLSLTLFSQKQIRVPDIFNQWDNEASICHIPELQHKNYQLDTVSIWSYFYLLKWLKFGLDAVKNSDRTLLKAAARGTRKKLCMSDGLHTRGDFTFKATKQESCGVVHCKVYLQATEFSRNIRCFIYLHPCQEVIFGGNFCFFFFFAWEYWKLTGSILKAFYLCKEIIYRVPKVHRRSDDLTSDESVVYIIAHSQHRKFNVLLEDKRVELKLCPWKEEDSTCTDFLQQTDPQTGRLHILLVWPTNVSTCSHLHWSHFAYFYLFSYLFCKTLQEQKLPS